MRRVACIALPQIRIEIVREREKERDAAPLAVVIARPGSTVRSERDVLGNTRLDVVSHEARARGVRAGQTVAAARAKCSELRVRVVAESAVRTALARVAEVAMAVGPTAGFDAATDVVWVEIGGCAHLFGGEPELASVLERRVLALGHACRVAIADGPRLAGAVARFSRGQGARNEGRVVPAGRGAEAMRALPMEALDLEIGTVRWLKDVGLRTCGDLQGLPKRSLGLRLGARTKDVMQLLAGEDRAPLDAWRPPEVPEERAELEWGAASVEAVVFVARALCEHLSARLEGRAMAATRVAIVLGLDRALLPDGEAATAVHEIAVPVPLVRAADLFAVVRSRLERVALPAPALAVTLRALELTAATARPLDLLTPEPKATRALPSLVAELATELGMDRVGVLALSDVWAPEDRTRLVPYGVRDLEKRSPAPLVTSAVEPSRLLRSASRTRAPKNSTSATADATHISRLEAVGWWKRGRSERRDFYEIWDGAGLAWAEVRGHEAWMRGWID